MIQARAASPVELVVPVDERAELRLVHPRMGTEMCALIRKDIAHLSRWLPDTVAASGKDFVVTMDIVHQRDAYNAGTAYPMALYVDDQLSGTVDIWNIGSATEVGYWIDKDLTGKGIVTRSAACLIEFAIGRHYIPSIVINTHVDNEKSAAVAERLGFTTQGISTNLFGIEERHFVRIYE